MDLRSLLCSSPPISFKGTCKSTGKVFQDITGKKDSPFDVKVGVGKVGHGDNHLFVWPLMHLWI